MINNKRVLAIVPARAGSKGLPGKNIRRMCGKPLIAWSIEQGLGCGYVDKVVVSTDSEEIASIAKDYGATVPFLRPPELSGDTASSTDVILHTLDSLKQAGEVYEYLVLLEPTSPLRETSDISGALALLESNPDVESVVGVAQVDTSHPSFLYVLDGAFLKPMSGIQPTGLRRQDLKEDYYFLEGSIYASRVETFRRHRSFYHDKTAPWVVDKYKAIEIDGIADFVIADALMDAQIKGILK
ncbi:MAG: acylneuraminate cytidylyltransferase family protein [Candidatus Protistobacter heckmanni]|nr:acylneuraminate cytidylyltransferase family protein [Candidatus Protistobacter heckmanni]